MSDKDTFTYKKGIIADQNGSVLYDRLNETGMSLKAKRRLAELVTEDNERDWMACWNILIAEGLMPKREDDPLAYHWNNQ